MGFIKNGMIFYKLFVWSATRRKMLSDRTLTEEGTAAARRRRIIRYIIVRAAERPAAPRE